MSEITTQMTEAERREDQLKIRDSLLNRIRLGIAWADYVMAETYKAIDAGQEEFIWRQAYKQAMVSPHAVAQALHVMGLWED